MTTEQNLPVSDPNPDNEEVKVGETILLGDPEPAKPAVTDDQPAEAEGVEYDPTGDTGLDMALQFIGKAGITSAHPGMVAAQQGDFSILKAALAAKGVQGWEQFVALGEDAFKRAQTQAQEKTANLSKLVHDTVGGAQEWQAIQKWAAANADPSEKAEINAMLNAGGLQAKQAAKYLAECYNKANNVERTPADPTLSALRGGTPAPNNGPLSPRDYAKEVAKLAATSRGFSEDSKEYKALQQRRLAWRG